MKIYLEEILYIVLFEAFRLSLCFISTKPFIIAKQESLFGYFTNGLRQEITKGYASESSFYR